MTMDGIYYAVLQISVQYRSPMACYVSGVIWTPGNPANGSWPAPCATFLQGIIPS